MARIPFRVDQTSVPIEGRVTAYTDAVRKVEFTTHRSETRQVWVWGSFLLEREEAELRRCAG